jgi:hypothetical protein
MNEYDQTMEFSSAVILDFSVSSRIRHLLLHLQQMTAGLFHCHFLSLLSLSLEPQKLQVELLVRPPINIPRDHILMRELRLHHSVQSFETL